VKELERHPFPRRDQIQASVAVEVDPHCGGDHASRSDQLRGYLLGDVRELAAVVA